MSSGPFDAACLFACPRAWRGVAAILAMGVLGALSLRKWRKPVHLLLLIAVVGGLAVSAFLLPALPVGGEPSPRIVACRRLKQVGLALMMYQEDNDGHLPLTLGHLFPYVSSGYAFVIENSGTPEPSTREEVDRGQCDFLYFGAGLADSADTTDVVVATTKPQTLAEEGYLCVFHLAGYVRVHTVIPQDVRETWDRHGVAVPKSSE